MTWSETSERPIGDELLAAGWRQGSIFTGPSLRFFYNNGQAVAGERATRPSERLVLVTQDCDVKSPDEPYVEAMLCRRRKGRVSVQLSPEVRKLTEEQMSVAEYFATRPLFLEYLTYRGDEVQGGEPFGRA